MMFNEAKIAGGLFNDVAGKISIVMPAYNAQKYIRESIESVLAQTYVNWELIVVDDGSIDGTASVVRVFANSDERIKYLYQSNSRQGRARNNGIAHAVGKYIAFLDADDIWLENKLELQLSALHSSGADLVFCDSYIFNTSFHSGGVFPKMNTICGYISGPTGVEEFLEYNRIPILTVLVKKNVIQLVEGFCEKNEMQNAEDYHLWLKMLCSNYLLFGMNESLAAYREHSESVSGSIDRLNTRQVIEVKLDIANNFAYYKSMVLKSIKNNFLYLFNRVDFPIDDAVMALFEKFISGSRYNYLSFIFHSNLVFTKIKTRVAYYLLNKLDLITN